MEKAFCVLAFVLAPLSLNYSQGNSCIYFPLEINNTWEYNCAYFPNSLISEIVDTSEINGHLYYSFAPYGAGPYNNWQKYWLRGEPNKIFALNVEDSSEYLLFNFDAEIGSNWEIPPVNTPPWNIPVNQCDWGSNITLLSNSDTVYNTNRVFYNCYRFGHFNHPCSDAGISETRFSRDFGIVRFAQITEGDVLDWELVITPPDTLSLLAIYTAIGNPCLTIPCIPGIVSAVNTNDTNYILTKNDNWFSGDFSWNGYIPLPDDSVLVKGISTNRTDIFGKKYFTLEVLEFTKHIPTAIYNHAENISAKDIQICNYPNPFNPSTIIKYSVPQIINNQSTIINLKVYDVLGNEIATLVNEEKAPGEYEVDFDASSTSRLITSGIYFYQLRVNNLTSTKKMVLLR